MEAHGIVPPETLVEDYELSHKNTVSTSQLDEICSNAQLLEDRVTQLSDAAEDLLKKQMDLKQYQQVLSATDKYFPGEVTRDLIELDDDQAQALLEARGDRDSNFITGVIPREKIPILEKILWRVLRGNLLFKTTEIEQKMYDQKAKEFVDKNSFVIFSHGEMILSRVRKICESLDADLYNVSSDSKSRQGQQVQINEQLTDITNVLENTNLTLTTELRVISSRRAGVPSCCGAHLRAMLAPHQAIVVQASGVEEVRVVVAVAVHGGDRLWRRR
ncbi:hypothetical protein PMKS-002644 [Pichia membranifaciens]|uniref:V-type proton ATPase subunit a n=1 Tax=Pichia membranifaciens TaxID=4926 RepID=A0A1Q2YHZ3_9ASCO|nr:hypothetical protein PMKS-002644 [Pichia membranifaciens]